MKNISDYMRIVINGNPPNIFHIKSAEFYLPSNKPTRMNDNAQQKNCPNANTIWLSDPKLDVSGVTI